MFTGPSSESWHQKPGSGALFLIPGFGGPGSVLTRWGVESALAR